jgi:hypothetical protein
MAERRVFREPTGAERFYSDEQLLDGIVLRPREFLRFLPHAMPSDEVPHLSLDQGQPPVPARVVGEINIGTEDKHAVGLITVEYSGNKPLSGAVVIFNPFRHHTRGGRRHSLHVQAGYSMAVGRALQPEVFPETVADRHCRVGVDEAGQFVIENGERSNATFVRRC